MMPGLYNFQNIRADIVGRLHQLRAHRRLSRRRPSRSHARHRAHGGHAGGRAEDGPGGDPPQELRRQRRIPLRHRHRPELRQRQLRRAARRRRSTRSSYQKLREEQEQAREAGPADGHRDLDLRRDLRHGAFARHSRRRLGKRHGEDRAHRQGHGDDRRSPHGQGEETTFAQIAADELGVGIDDVLVVHGDTAVVQYGIGTFGSRGTAVGGAALYYALQELKAKMKKFGAMLLESRRRHVRRRRLRRRQDRQIACRSPKSPAAAYRAMKLPPNTEPGLVATHFWEPPNFTFPFGAHIVVTEVDRETGAIAIKRYVAVDDCGNIINPLLVDGQVHGGVAQGLGQALWEQAVYDDTGQLVTGELMDYAIPKASSMPWIESSHTVTPSPVNPLGVKGVGEAGTIGCSPAVVNSVVDALCPLGVRHIDMPLTPEKIWKLIQAGGQA